MSPSVQLFHQNLKPKTFHSASKTPDAEKDKYFKLFLGKSPPTRLAADRTAAEHPRPYPGGMDPTRRSAASAVPQGLHRTSPALRHAQLRLLGFVWGLFKFFSPQNNHAMPPTPLPARGKLTQQSPLRAQPGDPNPPSNQGGRPMAEQSTAGPARGRAHASFFVPVAGGDGQRSFLSAPRWECVRQGGCCSHTALRGHRAAGFCAEPQPAPVFECCYCDLFPAGSTAIHTQACGQATPFPPRQPALHSHLCNAAPLTFLLQSLLHSALLQINSYKDHSVTETVTKKTLQTIACNSL